MSSPTHASNKQIHIYLNIIFKEKKSEDLLLQQGWKILLKRNI